ncbi:lipocalin family protein [Isoalcanivorax indicus]|uniref:lipocalin family protein n=1 Tax=Isoalcanivorax indicus TaxID=2202653 RepID=UPI000DBABA9F|nr:lipocalin family protein [Isoalcanivorax indicus]
MCHGYRVCHRYRTLSALPLVLLALLLGACQRSHLPEIRHAEAVELERFMGRWYVIGNIPTVFERGAHNAIEHYALRDDGRIDTTFSFRRDSFDGREREMNPVATVRDDPSNALWGMQFLWPFKADFRIVHVDEDYRETIIGRQKRDYVWIMARTPTLSEVDYQRLLALLDEEGYDISAIQRVPQCWQDECPAGDRTAMP